MYGNKPDHWQDELKGYGRLQVIANAFTRMRVCTADGEMQFKFKGELKDVLDGFFPGMRGASQL